MAGIPRRRPSESRHSYRLRCVDAEYTRRREDKIQALEARLTAMQMAHRREESRLFEELVRYYRAKPGTKYDRTAKKVKKYAAS